jgi:hypothetical protein
MQRYARIAIALFGFIAAFTLPPWVPIACIILLALRYRAWEAILIGALIDLVWLPAGTAHALPLFTILALIIVWGFEPLRAQFLLPQ